MTTSLQACMLLKQEGLSASRVQAACTHVHMHALQQPCMLLNKDQGVFSSCWTKYTLTFASQTGAQCTADPPSKTLVLFLFQPQMHYNLS
jgi:hypothetical protein